MTHIVEMPENDPARYVVLVPHADGNEVWFAYQTMAEAEVTAERYKDVVVGS